MCVVSMVMDHYWDKWNPYRPILVPAPQTPQPTWPQPVLPLPSITQEEINEFRTLLERAREYDRKHNQPDCELAEKKRKLMDLAKELGVDIGFIEQPEVVK